MSYFITFLYIISTLYSLLFSCWTLVGAAGEALGLDLTAALEQVAAPHAVAVSPVLAGGGGVTSHA